ncbi:MAG: stage III sporulation protein AF [Firmicutes bacterium]|nr:stage III sporulation protein AF [Bacillota bacterium]
MQTIFELTRKLMLLTIFAAFCELLLPRSSLRAYVRLVVGLLVIALLLQPLLELRGAPLNWEGLLALSAPAAGRYALPPGSWSREQAEALVEEQLAEKVRDLVAEEYPGYEVEVDLTVAYDQYGNPAELQKLEVNLRPGQPGITPVAPVRIGGRFADNRQSAAPGTVAALARRLGVSEDILSVWVYTGGGEADGQQY